jgi:hypothetical protein
VSLPFTTTAVDVYRDPNVEERWAPRTYTLIAAAVPANVTGASPTDVASAQATDQVVDAILHVQPGVDVQRLDRVRDAADGAWYQVVWVHRRSGLGLDRVRAGLRTDAGVQP